MNSYYPRPRGFTLIELLVVIAILAVLVAILFPVLARTNCGPGPSGRCRENLGRIMKAISMYAEDYEGHFPPHSYASGPRSVTLPAILHPYLKNQSVWHCPTVAKVDDGVGNYDGSLDDSSVSYGYNWLAFSPHGVGVSETQVGQPAETVAFVETTSHLAAPLPLIPAHGGTVPRYRHSRRINIAWTDGHVKAEFPGKLEAFVAVERGKPTGNGIDGYRYWNLR